MIVAALHCRDGVQAGELILVTTLDGREVEADVPDGVQPGDEFEVFVGVFDEDEEHGDIAI